MATMDSAAGGDAPAASVSDPFARSDPPLWEIALWPHRSLTRKGFRTVMVVLAAGLSIPLAAAWGTPAAMGLAPFLLLALALLWWAIRHNDRARARCGERVRLWADALAVEHCTPRGRVLRWAANPYWVRVDLKDAPKMEKYLTLSGGGRVIELGAFLSPDERAALAEELRAALSAVAAGRTPAAPGAP